MNEEWALRITSVSKPLFENMLFTTVYLLAFSRHQQLQRILVWINMWLWRQYCFFCGKYFIMRKYEHCRLLELSQVLKSSIQIACYSLRIYYSLAFVMRMRMFWLFFVSVLQNEKKTRELTFESSVWFGVGKYQTNRYILNIINRWIQRKIKSLIHAWQEPKQPSKSKSVWTEHVAMSY